MYSSVTENDAINDVLVSLGWDKEISIPLANKENESLCKLIDEKRRTVVLSKHEIANIKDKLGVIVEHKRQARLERSNCEAIVAALRNDIETENHMRQITERELGRIKQDIDKTKRRMVDVSKRKNIYENMNYTKSMELEDIKNEMQWNQQDLEKYLAECNHQEDLAKYLGQYTREDNSKADVLKHEISDLVNRKAKARKKLDELVIDTKILQVELDKTAEQYRQEHNSRKQVITMWQNTIELALRQDNEIVKVTDDLNEHKNQIRELESLVEEKRNMCANINNDNAEYERRITKLDREKATLRDHLNFLLQNMDDLKRETYLLQSTIERTSRECEIGRTTIKEMKRSAVESHTQLASMEKKVNALAEKCVQIEDDKQTTEELLVYAEDKLLEEEMFHNALTEELSKLREKQYTISDKASKQETLRRNFESDITTTRAHLRSLISRQGKIEGDLLKLDELIYKTDLNIQNLEHKISRLEGDNTSQEMQEELRMRINMLQEELDSTEKVSRQLTEMLKNITNDAGIHRLNIEKLKIVQAEQERNIVAEELAIDNSIRQQKLAQKKKEEQMVYRNMEKFQLRRLEKRCEEYVKNVTNLEVKKVNLTSLINERRAEIEFFKNMMKKDLRKLEEEKADLYRQLQDVRHKLGTIKAKYDGMASGKNKANEMDGLRETVEAAIEKEETQRYGDTLDLKIRKSEKELRALENTVVLLNSCNESFRYKNTTKVTAGSAEALMKEQIELDLKAEIKLHSLKRYQMRLVLKDIEKVSDNIDEKKKLIDDVNQRIIEVTEKIQHKQSDLMKIQQRLDRALNEYNNLIKSLPTDSVNMHDIKLRVNAYMAEREYTEVMTILAKSFPDIWSESAYGLFENSQFEIPPYIKVISSNISQRGSSNNNITRVSTGTRPLTMSVVDLGDNLNNSYSPSSISFRTESESAGSSSRSSVKLRLKNQGLKSIQEPKKF